MSYRQETTFPLGGANGETIGDSVHRGNYRDGARASRSRTSAEEEYSMSKLSPHAQYVHDLTCLGLTWFDKDGPDQELVTSALKHARSRSCDACKNEARRTEQNPGEQCVLRACGDPNRHTGDTRELIDAITAKNGVKREGPNDGAW